MRHSETDSLSGELFLVGTECNELTGAILQAGTFFRGFNLFEHTSGNACGWSDLDSIEVWISIRRARHNPMAGFIAAETNICGGGRPRVLVMIIVVVHVVAVVIASAARSHSATSASPLRQRHTIHRGNSLSDNRRNPICLARALHDFLLKRCRGGIHT